MEFRSTFFASCIASCLLVTSAAKAEGVYLLGSVGQSRINFDELNRSELDAGIESLGFTVDSSKFDKTDTGYKAQVGYQFNDNFAIEGGYIDLGTAVYKFNYSAGSASANGKFEWETKGWNIDALLTLPINAGVSLFGKFGLIRAETKLTVSASGPGGSSSADDKITKTSPLLGVGAAYNFWRGLSVRGEYEHFFNLGDKNDVGDKLTVDLFTVGLSYQF